MKFIFENQNLTGPRVTPVEKTTVRIQDAANKSNLRKSWEIDRATIHGSRGEIKPNGNLNKMCYLGNIKAPY